MVDIQGVIPAPLNYRGFPKSICTSVNHVVCHGIPGPRKLKKGDVLNIDITVIKDGYHGDTSRMFQVGTPPIAAQRVSKVAYECMCIGIRLVRPGIRLGWHQAGRHRPRHSKARRSPSLLGGEGILRPWYRPDVPRGPTSVALRRSRYGRRAGAGYDLHHRTDDQRRQTARQIAGRWLDCGYQRSLGFRSMGTHRIGHGHRPRSPHASSGRHTLSLPNSGTSHGYFRYRVSAPLLVLDTLSRSRHSLPPVRRGMVRGRARLMHSTRPRSKAIWRRLPIRSLRSGRCSSRAMAGLRSFSRVEFPHTSWCRLAPG